MKELYQEHIKYIDKICDETLIEFFDSFYLHPDTIDGLLLTLNELLPKDMARPIYENLKHNYDLSIGVNISYNSFVNYLYLLQCTKIRASDIVIDGDSGEIIVCHNEDTSYFDSTKITIQCKPQSSYMFSIISRDSGLAKFSGKMSFKDDGYHKIENLMNMFA